MEQKQKQQKENYIDLIQEEKNPQMQLALLREAYKKKELKETIREELEVDYKRKAIKAMLDEYPEILYPDFPWAGYIQTLCDQIFSDQNLQNTYKGLNAGQKELNEGELIEKLYDVTFKAKREIESNTMKQLEMLKIIDSDPYIMNNQKIQKKFNDMPPLGDKPSLDFNLKEEEYKKECEKYEKDYVLKHNTINELYHLIQEEIEKFDKLKKMKDKENYVKGHIGQDRKKFSDQKEYNKFVELSSLLDNINLVLESENLNHKGENLNHKGDLFHKLESTTFKKVFKGEKQKEIIKTIEKLKSQILKGENISAKLNYVRDEVIGIMFEMLTKENDKEKELNKSYLKNVSMTDSRLNTKSKINENMI